MLTLAQAGSATADYIPAFVVVLAGLSLLPFLLTMLTSFAKVVVVGGIVRQAVGTPQIPPTIVITGLALVLTVHIMAPVGLVAYSDIRAMGVISAADAEAAYAATDKAWSADAGGGNDPGAIGAAIADVKARSATTARGVGTAHERDLAAAKARAVSALLTEPGARARSLRAAVAGALPRREPAGDAGNVAGNLAGGGGGSFAGGADFQAVAAAVRGPLEEFLTRHAAAQHVELFTKLQGRLLERQGLNADPAKAGMPEPLRRFVVLAPAFVLTELSEAFMIGFLIFVPFLVIDLVVSNILLAMGMQMLTPTMVSLPLKLLVFVVMDGWGMILRGIVMGYA